MVKHLTILFIFYPEIAWCSAGAALDAVSIDQWLFGSILVTLGYFIKSVLRKLDKVISELIITNNKLNLSEERIKNNSKKLEKHDEVLTLLRERYHTMAGKLHLALNRRSDK